MYATELCGSKVSSKMMQMFREIASRRRVGYLWKAAGSGHSLDNGNTSFCKVVKLTHVSSFGNFIFHVLVTQLPCLLAWYPGLENKNKTPAGYLGGRIFILLAWP